MTVFSIDFCTVHLFLNVSVKHSFHISFGVFSVKFAYSLIDSQ